MRGRSGATGAAWPLMAVLLLAAAAGARPQQAPPGAADRVKWETLGVGARSPDGKRLAVPVGRSSGESELRARSLADETTKAAAYGSGPGS